MPKWRLSNFSTVCTRPGWEKTRDLDTSTPVPIPGPCPTNLLLLMFCLPYMVEYILINPFMLKPTPSFTSTPYNKSVVNPLPTILLCNTPYWTALALYIYTPHPRLTVINELVSLVVRQLPPCPVPEVEILTSRADHVVAQLSEAL